MEVFKSKVDLWLLIVLVVSIVISLMAAFFISRQVNTTSYFFGFFLVLAGAGLPLWLLVATQYTVNEEVLKIKSGPFKWLVPLAAITSVKDTCNPLSSPALSLDRLEISYEKGKKVMVSPIDKKLFRDSIGHPK
jgi:hypothetical protein